MSSREIELLAEQERVLSLHTDRMFGVVFAVQWALAVALALVFSPRTWDGEVPGVHLHVYAAVLGGGILSIYPIYLALKRAGQPLNRYIIAIAQIGYSCLLIHLTGGRIETHFHVFGSIAFLSAYRDPRPVLLATGLTALDHFARGALIPESVYGVWSASPLRALEHAAWVAFEDVFLLVMIRRSRREMAQLALHQARVESTLLNVEAIVVERTRALYETRSKVQEQEGLMLQASRMSALGEMAAGIAHEINNPLTVIMGKAGQLREAYGRTPLPSPEAARASLQKIEDTCKRIALIISGLRKFSRNSDKEPLELTQLSRMFEEVAELSRERFKAGGVGLELPTALNVSLECRPVEIAQVLVNLLNNAYDAVSGQPNAWVRVEAKARDAVVEIAVTDSGLGIPVEVAEKMMQPFFTTKEVGKGTGLGLSISRGIVEDHGGTIRLDRGCRNTRFVVVFPATQSARRAA